MRHFGLASVLVLALGTPCVAAAQQAGTPMGDIQDLNRFATRGMMNQWAATRPAHLTGMSPATEDWLKSLVQAQAEAPRPVEEVQAAIDETLGEAIHQAARAEHAKPQDISRALLLKVLQDVKSALAREARRVRNVPEANNPSWEERIAQAEANRKTALAMQTTTSRQLAMD